MEKSESIVNITKAILQVMKAVKGIDKTMTIGTGQNAYKGVPDQEVKKIVGEEMTKNGLAIIPIGIDDTTDINRWEEIDPYSKDGPKALKQKQSVFTKVKTKYLLIHESGEYITTMGYGHGVDSQDKSAGKATTYALKYALLYIFMIPTGKIDDADQTHSDSIPAPKQSKKPTNPNAGFENNLKNWDDENSKLDELLLNFERECDAPTSWKELTILYTRYISLKGVDRFDKKMTELNKKFNPKFQENGNK